MVILDDGYSWIVDCASETCPASPQTRGATRDDAISAWNTRVDVVPTIPISRLDEWLQRRSQFVEELYTPIDITMDWEGASVITNEYADGVLGTLQDLIDLLNEEGKP
jgi:hypothetical protein